ARRSLDKPIDPGQFDSLVSGGIASGMNAWQTLCKEAAEEAGLPPDMLAGARPAAPLYSQRQVATGLHREIIYPYDLALPADFQPINQDGEVSAMLAATVPHTLTLLAAGELCIEAGLTMLDFLLRHDLLEANQRQYAGLQALLASCRPAPPQVPARLCANTAATE